METIVKKLVKRVAEPFRPRLKPAFLIVGAQKAGTSALFDALARHPALIAPELKEFDFFSRDEDFNQGGQHYLARFPLQPWNDQGCMTFEASPSYLESAVAPHRIKEQFPGMRIIILLRDPVKRAFSAWNMYRQFREHPQYGHRHDPRSFEQAMEENMRGGAGTGPVNDYLERGRYAPSVKRYLDVFGESNMLLLSYLEYREHPQRVFDRVCDFLGIDHFPQGQPVLPKRKNMRPYEHVMEPALKERLYHYYTPAMKELRQLAGDAADICEEPTFKHLWT